MDALLADCAANPDDDGPRLVWADAVGGGRGELVVVQCDLARGGWSREQLETRRARERELLDRHAIEWAGEAGAIADRWSFGRGFVETATIDHTRLDEIPALRTAAPLLGTLTIHGLHRGAVEARHLALLRGLRGFGLVGDHLGDQFADVLTVLATFGLRALELGGLDARCLQQLHALLDASPIQTLKLHDVHLRRAQLDRLLRAIPQLESLALDPVELRQDQLSIAAQRPVRAFQFGQLSTAELASLAGTPLAASVERLALGHDIPRPELPKLVHRTPLADELLHHDPAAMLMIGAGRYRTAPTFELERLDTHEAQVFADRPVFERITIGRSAGNAMAIAHATLSRRHAEVIWNGSHHVLRDLSSHGGTYVNDERIGQRVLAEGDELGIGSLRFRFRSNVCH